MQESYTPLDWIIKRMQYWWLVTGCMIAGALCGLVVYSFQPTVYEASAVISVGIDYSRVGFLTDVEEDQIVEVVGDVIGSTEVLQGTTARAARMGADFVPRMGENVFLERKNFRWILRVRAEQSPAAVQQVNFWEEEANAALRTAYSHALVADGYLGYLESLVSCLEQSVALDTGQVFCSPSNLESLQLEIKKVNRALTEERLESKGIYPGVSFVVSASDETSALPIHAGKNLFALGGGALGALASFVWIPTLLKRKV